MFSRNVSKTTRRENKLCRQERQQSSALVANAPRIILKSTIVQRVRYNPNKQSMIRLSVSYDNPHRKSLSYSSPGDVLCSSVGCYARHHDSKYYINIMNKQERSRILYHTQQIGSRIYYSN